MRMTIMSVAIGLAFLTGCSTTSGNSTNASGVTSTAEGTALNVATQSNDIQVEYADDDYYITYLLETGVTTGGSGFGPGGDMQPGGGQRGKGDRNTTINETTNTAS